MQEFRGRIIAADWCVAKHAFTEQVHGNETAAPAAHAGEVHGHDPRSTTKHELSVSTGGLTAVNEQLASEGIDSLALSPGVPADLTKPKGKAETNHNRLASREPGSTRSTASDALADNDSRSSPEGSGDSLRTVSSEGKQKVGCALSSGSEDSPAGVSQADEGMLKRVLDRVLQRSTAERDEAASNKSQLGEKGTAEARVAKSKSAALKRGAAESDNTWQGLKAEPAEREEDAGSGVITKQVFVRNVPMDATPIELQARLQRFGAVKACRCTSLSMAHSHDLWMGMIACNELVCGSCNSSLEAQLSVLQMYFKCADRCQHHLPSGVPHTQLALAVGSRVSQCATMFWAIIASCSHVGVS
jgi:hypothetical protein